MKQEAERLCRAASPKDPDRANPALVSIWKSSDLMSFQFGILELIANETLADLPLNSNSQIYRIFDKCIRIYELTATDKKIQLRLSGDSPTALVCDKTFPIIPTVLIENAIKYSENGEVIEIRIANVSGTKRTRITVQNVTARSPMLAEIFSKGVRGASGGLGIGLYLANLVAKQHSSELTLDRQLVGANQERFTFSFEIPTI